MRRQRGNAKDITAFALLCAVCVDGQDMGQILRAHGWSGAKSQRRALMPGPGAGASAGPGASTIALRRQPALVPQS